MACEQKLLIIVFFAICHKPYDQKLAFFCDLAGAFTISAKSDAGNRTQSVQQEGIERGKKSKKIH